MSTKIVKHCKHCYATGYAQACADILTNVSGLTLEQINAISDLGINEIDAFKKEGSE